MNILFFLTPKSDVAFIYEDESLRQALEKMEYHKYSSVPMISRTGRYIGTITEGDMLWGIKNKFNLSLREAEHVPVTAIPRRSDYLPGAGGFPDGGYAGPGSEPELHPGGGRPEELHRHHHQKRDHQVFLRPYVPEGNEEEKTISRYVMV